MVVSVSPLLMELYSCPRSISIRVIMTKTGSIKIMDSKKVLPILVSIWLRVCAAMPIPIIRLKRGKKSIMLLAN